MKVLCAMCEKRLVFIVAARGYGSHKSVETHDLCDRCYRSMRDRVVAARMSKKPSWAVRSTLKVLEAQAVGKDTGC